MPNNPAHNDSSFVDADRVSLRNSYVQKVEKNLKKKTSDQYKTVAFSVDNSFTNISEHSIYSEQENTRLLCVWTVSRQSGHLTS